MNNPINFLARFGGWIRGFAASVLRVAAGEKGPVLPGYLPGPVAAPVEENVSPDEVTRLALVEPPVDDQQDSRKL